MKLRKAQTMRNKTMMLALGALTALAFVALPAVASAGEPWVDPASGSYPINFSVSGGPNELKEEEEGESAPIVCKKSRGVGKYISATTGELERTLEECTKAGTACTTTPAGPPSGVITTGTSVFHNIYVEPNKTTPAILVTPPTGGIYATFKCAFGLVEYTITGNGVIGDLEKPTCAAPGPTNTATLNFTATGASQTWKRITTAGTVFDLKLDANGSAAKTAALVAEMTVTFAQNVTLTCV
jgi:hypothetical protein